MVAFGLPVSFGIIAEIDLSAFSIFDDNAAESSFTSSANSL
jgi:hypothetical protein